MDGVQPRPLNLKVQGGCSFGGMVGKQGEYGGRGAAMLQEPESSGAAAAFEECLVSMEDMEDGGAIVALART